MVSAAENTCHGSDLELDCAPEVGLWCGMQQINSFCLSHLHSTQSSSMSQGVPCDAASGTRIAQLSPTIRSVALFSARLSAYHHPSFYLHSFPTKFNTALHPFKQHERQESVCETANLRTSTALPTREEMQQDTQEGNGCISDISRAMHCCEPSQRLLRQSQRRPCRPLGCACPLSLMASSLFLVAAELTF